MVLVVVEVLLVVPEVVLVSLYPRLGKSRSHNQLQSLRFRTLEELQTWDRVRKLPFEILPLKPVPMLRFERNLTGNKKL